MLDLVQHPYGETYNSLFNVMTFYGLKKTMHTKSSEFGLFQLNYHRLKLNF